MVGSKNTLRTSYVRIISHRPEEHCSIAGPQFLIDQPVINKAQLVRCLDFPQGAGESHRGAAPISERPLINSPTEKHLPIVRLLSGARRTTLPDSSVKITKLGVHQALGDREDHRSGDAKHQRPIGRLQGA
jgi:hypothetical protein